MFGGGADCLAAALPPVPRGGVVVDGYEKFRVEMVEAGELRKLTIEAECEGAARRAAMAAAKDRAAVEVVAIRPLRIGFAQAA